MSASHNHPAPAPLGGPLWTPTTKILAALVAIAGVILLVRFIFGLGAVTNINDGYTWGIWVVYDVVIGSAFACGGYSVALLVYIFNKGEYHPMVRPALLASLFGYTLAGAGVIFDLGRYWNFWHIFWPGYAQPNSVMFEVAVCISAYIVVMWIEFSPAFLEKFGMKDTKKKLSKVLFFIIALGTVLPSMHQSSLGSLLVVFGYQVHPLWQSILLPLFYLMTAITIGFAIVVFEACLSSSGFKRPLEMHLLGKLSKVMLGMLVAYLVVRFVDLAVRGALRQHVRAQYRGLHVLGRNGAVRRTAGDTVERPGTQESGEAVHRGLLPDHGRLHPAHQFIPGRLRNRPGLALLPVRLRDHGFHRHDRAGDTGIHRAGALPADPVWKCGINCHCI